MDKFTFKNGRTCRFLGIIKDWLAIKKDAIVASHTILDLLEKGGKLVF